MKNKRFIKGLFLIVTAVIVSFCSGISTPCEAAWSNAASDLNVNVNGKTFEFIDLKPYIDSEGRIMVPVRFLCDRLGADSVHWDSNSNEISVKKGTDIFTIVFGQNDIVKNGTKLVTMDTIAVIRNGYAYVPLRFVAESLGANVLWDSSANTVSITGIEDFE